MREGWRWPYPQSPTRWGKPLALGEHGSGVEHRCAFWIPRHADPKGFRLYGPGWCHLLGGSQLETRSTGHRTSPRAVLPALVEAGTEARRDVGHCPLENACERAPGTPHLDGAARRGRGRTHLQKEVGPCGGLDEDETPGASGSVFVGQAIGARLRSRGLKSPQHMWVACILRLLVPAEEYSAFESREVTPGPCSSDCR